MLLNAMLRERTGSCVRTNTAIVPALVSALEAHDESTKDHAERTQTIAAGTAIQLGLDAEEIWTVQMAAVLHDIGKVAIPKAVLDKPAKFTEEEWEIMRRHSEIGADMLENIPGFERVRDAVLYHHERFDGRGYQTGLAGEDIPIEARLICAVDAYDAMTNDRPYRKALSHEEAIEQLDQGAGSQFDPTVVEAVKAVTS